MARKTVTPAPSTGLVTTIPKDYVAEQQKVVALIPTLQTEVDELQIGTAEQYLYADTLLGRIDQQRKAWGMVWDRIQEKTIKPLRSALDGLYSVNRDIDKPLETLRETVRKQMTGYKETEARQIREAETKRQREENRLRREAEEAERKAAFAKTPQMRGRLQAQAEQKQTQAAAVAAQDAPLPTIGASSSTRTTPKLRITNWAEFLKAAAEDETVAAVIPQDATEAALNKLWKADPDVALWPGIEKYDSINVVGR